jgi:hypothetical protein
MLQQSNILNRTANNSTGKRVIKVGGFDDYSLRSSTLVEGYIPGAMRQNIRQDAELIMGKIDFGTFGSDENYNGPGTISQAIPNLARFQNAQIFEVPRPNPNKLLEIDDRQIASYQVDQLKNNPLSIFTNNPNGSIPGFDCLEEPDNFSNMTNKREADFKSFFEEGLTINPKTINGSQYVYPTEYDVELPNPNAAIVYNLSLNSLEEVNPLISLGSSNVSTNIPEFSGGCYSGKYTPSYGTDYDTNIYVPRTSSDIGMQNLNIGDLICESGKSMSFTNPLILNNF